MRKGVKVSGGRKSQVESKGLGTCGWSLLVNGSLNLTYWGTKLAKRWSCVTECKSVKSVVSRNHWNFQPFHVISFTRGFRTENVAHTFHYVTATLFRASVNLWNSRILVCAINIVQHNLNKRNGNTTAQNPVLSTSSVVPTVLDQPYDDTQQALADRTTQIRKRRTKAYSGQV